MFIDIFNFGTAAILGCIQIYCTAQLHVCDQTQYQNQWNQIDVYISYQFHLIVSKITFHSDHLMLCCVIVI